MSCNSSINSDWLSNILDITSNCKVQSLRVAGNHVYSHMGYMNIEGQSINQTVKFILYKLYLNKNNFKKMRARERGKLKNANRILKALGPESSDC